MIEIPKYLETAKLQEMTVLVTVGTFSGDVTHWDGVPAPFFPQIVVVKL